MSLIIAAALILAACAPATPAGPTPIRLLVTFMPDIQYAPFYVGLEKGFFKQHNLDVTLEYLAESDVTKQVATGQAPFGVVSGEQVLLAREQGLPVVYVYAWFQAYPVAVMSRAEKNIVEPKDLKGKTVGVPLKQGATYIGLEAILQAAGLTDADITLKVTGFNQVQTLIADQADAVVVYANNEPVQIDALNVDVNLINVADSASLVSNGLITGEKTIQDHPDLVKALDAAFSQSLQYTLDHPDEAYTLSAKYVQGLNDPAVKETQRNILVESYTFWQAKKLGQSSPTAWAKMQDVLATMGLLAKQQDVNAAFSNNFLP
jgi:NitT/TauT family transport system substrate-binding protein